jgi:hypothetical protein
MFLQKSAEFHVLRSERSLCVVHTAIVILTMTPLQILFGIEPWASAAASADIHQLSGVVRRAACAPSATQISGYGGGRGQLNCGNSLERAKGIEPS